MVVARASLVAGPCASPAVGAAATESRIDEPNCWSMAPGLKMPPPASEGVDCDLGRAAADAVGAMWMTISAASFASSSIQRSQTPPSPRSCVAGGQASRQ
eukprot:2273956-Prymnesium_polylepis.1